MPRAGAHALLTRPPLGATPKDDAPFDLHVLGAPPAFVLSQDQTLSFISPISGPKPQARPPASQKKRRHPHPRPARRGTSRPRHHMASPRRTKARRASKAMTSPPGTRPPPARLPAARAPDPGTRKTSRHLRMRKDQQPHSRPPPAHPFLPLPHSVKQQRCGAWPRLPGPRRPSSGTRYIVSSPARLKALFGEIRFVNLSVQVLDPTLRIS